MMTGKRTVGQATPVAPFGIMDTMTPSYEWTPVQYATRYRLLVQNVAEETIIEEWFTVEEGECLSEESLCMVTPDIEIIGAHTWKVLACLGGNCGLWSDDLSFSYNVMGPPQERFTDNGDDTVTDNNTQLMWDKNANRWGRKTWNDALSCCADLIHAGRSDWRLPTIWELISLVGDRYKERDFHFLAAQFSGVQAEVYGTSTELPNFTSTVYTVDAKSGFRGFVFKRQGRLIYVWSVRSDS